LDNAVKYSPSTSTIELRADGRLDSPGGNHGVITISIRNSGSVIPDREQPHIFERFYRGSEGRRISGSGMGLAIVKQIAEAHGGSISVSSRREIGTEFTLSLPRGGTAS